MYPLWNGRSNNVLLKYPNEEILLAREDFRQRWTVAIRRDESVREINEAYLRYPPNVLMKNCREYPFAQENTIYRMPSIPTALSPTCHKSRHKPVHSKFRFTNACMRMTESSLRLINDQINQSTNDSVFYVCDHCPFSAHNSESALNHLKSKGHVSCSEYINSKTNMDDESGSQVSILRTPRNLYNAEGSMPGWSPGDIAVFCPTCFLLLPDKLLCAYHHYSQHRGYIPKFAYGTVLDSRDFIVSLHHTKCPQCMKKFPNHSLLLQHWFGPRQNCRSPFYPVQLEERYHASQVVDVYCDLCRTHFDRIPPPTSNSSFGYGGNKHKHNDRDPNSEGSRSWLHWSEGFCKFCLNHVLMHCNQFPKSLHFACRLRIRFVRLDRQTSQNLSAYLYQNDSSLILRFLRECKLLISYLKFCHGGRRSLIKQAKQELDKLIQQSQVCVT